MIKFDFDKVNNFDKHISTSISGYSLLRGLICNLSTFFLKGDCNVIDLGCTSGQTLKKISLLSDNINLIGYDIIDKHFVNSDKIKFIKKDITEPSFVIPENNLTLLVFTLQFIDYNKRLKLLKKIYNSLQKGGAVIICEKEYQKNGIFQDIFTFSNYTYKKNNFSAEDILNKEQQLRISMQCLSENENIKMFKKCGFNKIDIFFKSLLFKGYLCIK